MPNPTSAGTTNTYPRCKRLHLIGTYGLLLSLTFSAGAASFADIVFADIVAAENQAIAQGVETQQRIDQIDDEHAQLLSEYRTAVKQAEDLIKYNDQLRSVRQSQEREAASLNEQLQRVGNLEGEIVPLMSDMLNALEEFIALDAPFLPNERRDRVARLRTLFASSEVSNSEKYRRILEAYQIENDYGRTIEAYDAVLPRDNARSEQIVTFLKIGRAVFLYQTLDGSRSYYWHRESRRWVPLADSFNREVTRGIRMAREQIPSDLLLLPVAVPNN